MGGLFRNGQEASAEEVGAERARVDGDLGPLGLSYSPDRVQVDQLDFKCSVSAAGVITLEDQAQKSLPTGYHSELIGITAAMELPGTEPELAMRIFFNIKDRSQGGQNLFTDAIRMQSILDVGAGHGTWEAREDSPFYRFKPGSDVKCIFSLDDDSVDGYAAVAAAAKTWCVSLKFRLVRL